jgi:hypothetical protein
MGHPIDEDMRTNRRRPKNIGGFSCDLKSHYSKDGSGEIWPVRDDQGNVFEPVIFYIYINHISWNRPLAP